LTQQLLVFSHLAPPRPAIVNLADVIMSSVRVLRRVLGPDVRIVTTLAREAGLVRADSNAARARAAEPRRASARRDAERRHADDRDHASRRRRLGDDASDLRDWASAMPPSLHAHDLLSGFVRVSVATRGGTICLARTR